MARRVLSKFVWVGQDGGDRTQRGFSTARPRAGQLTRLVFISVSFREHVGHPVDRIPRQVELPQH